VIYVDPHCHTASIRVEVPAQAAFEYLADGLKQGEWALGGQGKRAIGEGLYAGTSMFHGGPSYVRPHPDPERLTITYEVGPSLDEMRAITQSRVVPGPTLNDDAGSCVITFASWRRVDQDDAAWTLHAQIFNLEVHTIKNRLEGRWGK
jgi:hypothetical protein